MQKILDYLSEVKKEMDKVNWPKQQELINNTILVLIFSVVLSLMIFFADQVISTGLEFIYG